MAVDPSTARTVLKYALVQIPSAALVLLGMLLLRQWLEFPGWVVGGVLALWIVKDILLFPAVRKAYEPGEAHGGSLIGARGTARDRLDPGGYVLVRGELWQAEVPPGVPPVETGKEIRVLGLRGLTLLVVPADPPEPRGIEPGS